MPRALQRTWAAKLMNPARRDPGFLTAPPSRTGTRSYLESTKPGLLDEPAEAGKLLAMAWENLEGSEDQGMTSVKLLDRMEDVCWEPPELSFTIERHGATVLGFT